jgi:hypothetical protein
MPLYDSNQHCQYLLSLVGSSLFHREFDVLTLGKLKMEKKGQRISKGVGLGFMTRPTTLNHNSLSAQ